MGIFDIIALVLILAWLGGYGFHLGGDLIHFLLVIAVVVFLLRFIKRNV